MTKQQRRRVAKLADKLQGAVGRLAEALDGALRGKGAAPELVPARRPTADELRDYARRRGH